MKNMKNLLTSLLAAATVAASAFSLASCSSAGAKDLDKVQEKGTLVVGMECAYAPYNWAQTTENEYTVRVSDGMYADGYDVQVAKKIAEHLNVTLVIQPLEWDGLIPALNANTIDLVIAGMSPTNYLYIRDIIFRFPYKKPLFVFYLVSAIQRRNVTLPSGTSVSPT